MYFLKTQINKKTHLFFPSYLHKMFIEYSEEYTYSNFKQVLHSLQIKSSFHNQGDVSVLQYLSMQTQHHDKNYVQVLCTST